MKPPNKLRAHFILIYKDIIILTELSGFIISTFDVLLVCVIWLIQKIYEALLISSALMKEVWFWCSI